MKRNFGNWILICLIISGCYPYPAVEITDTDLDIAITQYRDSVDFDGYNTYIIIDSVTIISDAGEPGNDDPFYENEFDEVIVDEIRSQMDALGYVEVFQVRNADVGLVATLLRSENENINTPGWWWGYQGFAWWWQAWFGTPYPYDGQGETPDWYNTFYLDRTGTLMINMVDLEVTSSGDAFIWYALINGLFEDQAQITPDRITRSIDAAFKQSRNFYEREIEE